MLLEFVKGFSLLLNHISVCEGEVVDPLDSFHSQIVAYSLSFLVLENLVGLNESVNLVSLILLLELSLFVHLLTLKLEKALFIFPILDLVYELSVSLLMNLVDDLTKEVIIV